MPDRIAPACRQMEIVKPLGLRVDKFRIGHRRRLLELVYRRPIRLQSIGPVVSFTFDDFPRTAYTTGGSILKDLGARATFYAAMGMMNSTNDSGDQFVMNDLYKLVADGHELASHTFHHVSSASVPADEFLQDAVQGYGALRRLPNLRASKNFAYPFGTVTAATKCVVGKVMSSCRSTFPGINGAVSDLNMLRANTLVGDADKLSALLHLIQQNEVSRGWLIFVTHDVRQMPSQYGCTPKLLRLVAKAVVGMSIRILTIDEVLTMAARVS